jgi:hypothetical protein
MVRVLFGTTHTSIVVRKKKNVCGYGNNVNVSNDCILNESRNILNFALKAKLLKFPLFFWSFVQ